MPNHVGAYVDYLAAHGVKAPKRVVGAVAAQVKKLTEEGQPDEHIDAALRLLADRGSPPVALPECLVSAVRRIRRAPVAEFVAEYGWPTGCRFVRGSHAGTHVYDPLGTDRPPDGWPYFRPDRDEVEPLCGALAALGDFLRGKPGRFDEIADVVPLRPPAEQLALGGLVSADSVRG